MAEDPIGEGDKRAAFLASARECRNSLIVAAVGCATVLTARWVLPWAGRAALAVFLLFYSLLQLRHLQLGAHAFWGALAARWMRPKGWRRDSRWLLASYAVHQFEVFLFVACAYELSRRVL